MLTRDKKVPRVLANDIRVEVALSGSIDDKVRAEDLASESFSLLFVKRGTVIKATRDFKALDLREIMRLRPRAGD